MDAAVPCSVLANKSGRIPHCALHAKESYDFFRVCISDGVVVERFVEVDVFSAIVPIAGLISLFSPCSLQLWWRDFVRAYTVQATFIAHGVPSADKNKFTTGTIIVGEIIISPKKERPG